MNFSTIVIFSIVILCAGGAAYKIYIDKKNGKSSCGGNCSSCGSMCHDSKAFFETIKEKEFGK